MSGDTDRRHLERRWRESGTEEDGEAFLRDRIQYLEMRWLLVELWRLKRVAYQTGTRRREMLADEPTTADLHRLLDGEPLEIDSGVSGGGSGVGMSFEEFVGEVVSAESSQPTPCSFCERDRSSSPNTITTCEFEGCNPDDCGGLHRCCPVCGGSGDAEDRTETACPGCGHPWTVHTQAHGCQASAWDADRFGNCRCSACLVFAPNTSPTGDYERRCSHCEGPWAEEHECPINCLACGAQHDREECPMEVIEASVCTCIHHPEEHGPDGCKVCGRWPEREDRHCPWDGQLAS